MATIMKYALFNRYIIGLLNRGSWVRIPPLAPLSKRVLVQYLSVVQNVFSFNGHY